MSQSERIAMDPDIELGRSHHPQYIDQQWEASSSVCNASMDGDKFVVFRK